MGAIERLIEDENGAEFRVSGIKFRFINSQYNTYKTTEDEIIILKGPGFLKHYEPIFEKAPTQNMLEFGVFEGGSIILFALAYPEFKFVGIDIRPPSEHVLRHIRDLGLQDRVKIYYNVSQADKEQIDKAVRDEFGNAEIGIISDDASHNYRFSKVTFELSFGRMASGGFYCLEDWAWAHWGEPFQTQVWTDQPALTNLVFELLMMYASTPGLIDRIEVLPALVLLKRGVAKRGDFKIDELIKMRGKKLTLI